MKNKISGMISFPRQKIIFWKDGLNEVSLKVINETSFDERSTFFLEEGTSKEEGNYHESSIEERIKSMRFEND